MANNKTLSTDWFFHDLDNSISLDKVFSELKNLAIQVAKDSNFNDKYVVVNNWMLYSTILRYSRDVYGLERLSKVLVENSITGEQHKTIINTVKNEKKGLGLRIVSQSPYIHKKIAFLLYHLTVTKPFSLIVDDMCSLNEKQIYVITHFNTIVSLCLVQILLLEIVSNESHRSILSENLYHDKEFIHELTYRNLSRSAIESVMRYSIKQIATTKYIEIINSRKKV